MAVDNNQNNSDQPNEGSKKKMIYVILFSVLGIASMIYLALFISLQIYPVQPHTDGGESARKFMQYQRDLQNNREE